MTLSCGQAKSVSHKTSKRQLRATVSTGPLSTFKNKGKSNFIGAVFKPLSNHNRIAMNQSEFLAITFKLLKARENHAYEVRLVLVLHPTGLKKGRENFNPITTRSNCNHVITFDSHLKTFYKFLLSTLMTSAN